MILNDERDLNKAQYLMSRANTLLLTGSIFVLAFITMFTSANGEYTILSYILSGLCLFGIVAIFEGLSCLFEADRISNLLFETKDNCLNYLNLLIFSAIIPTFFIVLIMKINPWSIEFGLLSLGFIFSYFMINVTKNYYKQSK